MSKPVIIATFEKNRRETVRIALDEYRGAPLIDLRVTVPLSGTSDIQTPTRKGLSLNVELLPALVAALRAAEVEARARGLIPGGAA